MVTWALNSFELILSDWSKFSTKDIKRLMSPSYQAKSSLKWKLLNQFIHSLLIVYTQIGDIWLIVLCLRRTSMMTKMHYNSTRVLALSKCHIMVQVIKFHCFLTCCLTKHSWNKEYLTYISTYKIILNNTNIFQQSLTKALCYTQNYHMVPLSQS